MHSAQQARRSYTEDLHRYVWLAKKYPLPGWALQVPLEDPPGSFVALPLHTAPHPLPRLIFLGLSVHPRQGLTILVLVADPGGGSTARAEQHPQAAARG